jgi:hypothetical protein
MFFSQPQHATQWSAMQITTDHYFCTRVMPGIRCAGAAENSNQQTAVSSVEGFAGRRHLHAKWYTCQCTCKAATTVAQLSRCISIPICALWTVRTQPPFCPFCSFCRHKTAGRVGDRGFVNPETYFLQADDWAWLVVTNMLRDMAQRCAPAC